MLIKKRIGQGVFYFLLLLCCILLVYHLYVLRSAKIAEHVCLYAYDVMQKYLPEVQEGNYEQLDAAKAEIGSYIQEHRNQWGIDDYYFDGNYLYIRFKYGVFEERSWFPVPGIK